MVALTYVIKLDGQEVAFLIKELTLATSNKPVCEKLLQQLHKR